MRSKTQKPAMALMVAFDIKNTDLQSPAARQPQRRLGHMMFIRSVKTWFGREFRLTRCNGTYTSSCMIVAPVRMFTISLELIACGNYQAPRSRDF